MGVEEALAAFLAMPTPPTVGSTDCDEDVPSASDGGSFLADSRKITVGVRYVSGASTTLVVDEGATVASLMRRALHTFFPSRLARIGGSVVVVDLGCFEVLMSLYLVCSDLSALMAEHHVLYAGRFLPSDGPISSVGLEQESCLHIVKRPTRTADSSVVLSSASAAATSPLLAAPLSTPRVGIVSFSRAPTAASPGVEIPSSPAAAFCEGLRPSPGGNFDPSEPAGPRVDVGSTTPARRMFSPSSSPREVRPSDVDTTLVRFKMQDAPADVEFEDDGVTTSTNGKWVTVMADMPGVSSGKLEWEIEV
jgi:hypothetical protein